MSDESNTQRKLSARDMATYHSTMLYREAVHDALEYLSIDHPGPCCQCRAFADQARELLAMAQEIGDLSMENWGSRR